MSEAYVVDLKRVMDGDSTGTATIYQTTPVPEFDTYYQTVRISVRDISFQMAMPLSRTLTREELEEVAAILKTAAYSFQECVLNELETIRRRIHPESPR